jgi:hypothetical protein
VAAHLDVCPLSTGRAAYTSSGIDGLLIHVLRVFAADTREAARVASNSWAANDSHYTSAACLDGIFGDALAQQLCSLEITRPRRLIG